MTGVQTCALPIYSYEAQGLDAQINELTAKKSELEVQNVRLTSLDKVKNSNVAAAMVKTETRHAE